MRPMTVLALMSIMLLVAVAVVAMCQLHQHIESFSVLVHVAPLPALERAAYAGIARKTLIPQLGMPYQSTARQPTWAASIAAKLALHASYAVATDTLTAVLDSSAHGLSIIGTTRQPARILLVLRVHNNTLPVLLVPLGASIVPQGGSIRQITSADVSPGVLCYTAAEVRLCSAVLGAVGMQQPHSVPPLSRAGTWALLLPLDSPLLSKIQDLHFAQRVTILDYLSNKSVLSEPVPVPVPVRTAYVDAASILTSTQAGASHRLALAALDWCVLTRCQSNVSAAISSLPDVALMDLGEIAHMGSVHAVCGASLALAARRFSSWHLPTAI